MRRSEIPVILALAVVLSCLPMVEASDFPGTGNAADWSEALPHYNLGNRYLSRERFDDAAKSYEEAIKHYPFDADFHINLGVAYRKLDDYPAAERAFRKAIELNDKDWTAWSNLANAYLKQNRLEDCLKAFERTLKLNPPANEQANIRKDMADIKKILTMNGGAAAAGSKTQQAAPRPAGKQARRSTGDSRKPGALVSAAGSKDASSEASSSRSQPGSSNPSPPAPRPADLTGSGWDYVYK